MAKIVNSLVSVRENLRYFNVEVSDELIATALREAIIARTPIYGTGGFLNPKHPAHPNYWTKERRQGK
jgi:hypothetical protein